MFKYLQKLYYFRTEAPKTFMYLETVQLKKFQLSKGYLIVKFQEKDEVRRITYLNNLND